VSNVIKGAIGQLFNPSDEKIVGTQVGTVMGTDLGINPGINMGTDMDTDLGTDTGTDMGIGTDTNIGIDLGTNMGTGTGTDIGTILGTDMGTFIDSVLMPTEKYARKVYYPYEYQKKFVKSQADKYGINESEMLRIIIDYFILQKNK
jgi:uncharacterized protein YcfJ